MGNKCIDAFHGKASLLVLLCVVGEEIDDSTVAKETEALTEIQAAAVKKRIDTLNATFKKRKRQKRTDVRNVFDSSTQVDKLHFLSLFHHASVFIVMQIK